MMFYPNLSRAQLAATDYGRGAERFIRGARFAVFTLEPSSAGVGGPAHVVSTYRTEAAAVKAHRRIFRGGSGRVHYGEITES